MENQGREKAIMKHHTLPSLYEDYEREVIIRLIKTKNQKETAK